MKLNPAFMLFTTVVGYISTLISSATYFWLHSAPMHESFRQSTMLSIGFWNGFEGAAGAFAMALLLNGMEKLPFRLRFPATIVSLGLVFLISAFGWGIPAAMLNPTLLGADYLPMFIDSAVTVAGVNGLIGAIAACLCIIARFAICDLPSRHGCVTTPSPSKNRA